MPFDGLNGIMFIFKQKRSEFHDSIDAREFLEEFLYEQNPSIEYIDFFLWKISFKLSYFGLSC